MTTPMRTGFDKHTRRLPPALVTDLPVLALLVICWLLVPVAWAHLTTGLALIVLIGVHLWTRRRRLHRLFRRNSPALSARRLARRFGYWLFLAAAAAMTVTGLLRWAGVTPQYVWHGGVSYFLLGLVVVHLWTIRRPLRARLRSGRASPRRSHRSPILRWAKPGTFSRRGLSRIAVPPHDVRGSRRRDRRDRRTRIRPPTRPTMA